MGILIPLILIAISCLIIGKSATSFTTASNYLGRDLSKGVKGATINAIASSMPELLTTLFFLFYLNDIDGFSGGIGITAGSATFNIMIIPALVFIVVLMKNKKISISKKTLLRDSIFLFVTELVFINIISRQTIYWWHGLIFILLYLAYIMYMFLPIFGNNSNFPKAQRGISIFYNPDKNLSSSLRNLLILNLDKLIIGKRTITKSSGWWVIIVSTLVMSIGSFLLVLATDWLGKDIYEVPLLGEFHGLGIPLIFVAVILSAAASSLPDTIISVLDAKKGYYDDAISNALGSNIFDISFAIGLPLLLYTLLYNPIEMSSETIRIGSEIWAFLFIITLCAFLIFFIGKHFNRKKVIMLIGFYLLFMIYVIGKSYDLEIANQVSTFLLKLVEAMKF